MSSAPPNQTPEPLPPTATTPTSSTSPNKSPDKAAAANNNNNKENGIKKADSQHEIQKERPMELANPEQKEEIGAFKKLFLKIGQSVGTVKTSEFSEDYLAAATEVDNYKAYLIYLLASVTKVIQQNADFIPPPDKIGPNFRVIEAPAGEDPYEKMEKSLGIYQSSSSHPKECHVLSKVCKDLAKAHRKFQNKARGTFHNIRTFLKVDLEDIFGEREKVVVYRQQMDFAKHEMENAPDKKGKIRSYEKAKKVYETQCQKVITIVKEMSTKRAEHQKEVYHLMEEMKKFHEIAAEECAKVRSNFEKLANETSNLPRQFLPGQQSNLDDSQK